MRHALKALPALLLAAACAATAAAAGSSGWLVQAQGSIEVTGPSGSLEVKVPLEIPSGSTLRSGSGGSALFMLADGTKIQLRPDSTFTYEDSSNESLFSLVRGAISLWVKPQGLRRLGIRTPGAVASVRGTIVDADTDGTTSHFDLHEGELLVGDAFGKTTIATRGQRVSANATRGLSGTSSLPPGSHARSEPEGSLPLAAKRGEAARNEKKETKEKTKAEVDSDSEGSKLPSYQGPTSNPTQELDTAPLSPSAP